MARLFLSYSREDRARVEPLAAAIEAAGHELWWDRKIAGGSEYSSEIEAALEDAEAVIVVWSRVSTRSAWVRDEAAFARDHGKLLPVLIDDGGPPLGFRQIHAVDLNGWDGGNNSPALAELLRAVDVRTGTPPRPRPAAIAQAPVQHAAPVAENAPAARPKRWSWLVAGLVLLLFVKCTVSSDDPKRPRISIEADPAAAPAPGNAAAEH